MALKFLNDGYFAGKVGIGIESPDRKLHVKDSAIVVSEFEGTNTGSLMDLVNSNASQLYNGIRFTQGATSKMAITHIADGTTKGYIQIGNSWATGSEILVVDGRTSNVGIGTTSPGYKLQVNDGNVAITGGTTSTLFMNITTNQLYGDVNGVVILKANDNLRLNTNGAERIRILNNGNVGIGTTSPDAKLDVIGQGIFQGSTTSSYKGANVGTLNINNNSADGTVDFTQGLVFTDNVTNQGSWTHAGIVSVGSTGYNGSLVFGTDGDGVRNTSGITEKMRITSGGRVGIGTTNPTANLHVYTSTNSSTIEVGRGAGRSSIKASADADGGYLALDSSGNGLILNHYSSDNVWLVTGGGNVGVGTTGPSQKLHVSGNARITGAYYDSNNSPGTANQVLVSTATGTDWVDGSGSSIIGGPYLPLAGGTMTGDVRFDDGVEIEVGTSRDLVINHDGSNSYIKQLGTGNLYIRQSVDDGDIIFQSDNGGGGVATYFKLDGNIAKTVFSRDVQFSDNAKALFGNSYDLQIYHDGTNSIISDEGVGLLAVRGSEVKIKSPTTTEVFARFIENSSVELYYDGDKKFETTSAGVTVTGQITTTGTSPSILFNETDVTANWRNRVSSGSYRVQYASDGSTFSDHFVLGASANTIVKDTTFTGDITSVGLTVDYTGNRTGDAGILVTNDASDWGIKVDKDGTADYGILSQTDGENAIVVRNAAGTTNIQLQGDGDASFAGSLTIPDYIYHTSDPNTFFGFDGNDQIAIKTSGNYNFFGDANATTLYAAGNIKLKTSNVSVGTATTTGGTLIDGWITTTQANAVNNTTIATTAYVNNKIALIPAGLVFQGTWNASTNTPTLTSGSGTTGNFYIVSVAGSTNLDGITDWKVGDWAVFIEQGASDQWEKIDNSSVLDGFGTGQSVTKWDGSGTSNTLTNGPITFSTSDNNSTFTGDLYIPNKIIHVGDENTWMQFETDVISLRTGGTDRLTLTNSLATFSGTVTVNTSNSGILTLNRTTSAGGYMRFQNDGTDKFYIGSRGTVSGSGGTGYDIYAVGGNDIRFFPGTLLALTLDTSANATFAGTLTVEGADAITIPDYILHAGDDSKFGFPSNDNFKVRLAGTDKFTMSATINRFSNIQNAGSRLELYNNRQDAGNVEVYRIAAYNQDEVAGIHFYRGSGGSSGYNKNI